MPARSRRAWFGTAALAAALALGGCHSPGGPLYSADKFTYVSSEWQPWTVTVIDTRTGESVWSVDVPVGEQLVVGFSSGTGPNEHKPDEIVWGVMPAGRWFGTRDNRQACPPSSSRRLDARLRPTPEMAGTPVPGSPFGEVTPRPIRRAEGRVVVPIEPESNQLGDIQRPDPEPAPDEMEIPEQIAPEADTPAPADPAPAPAEQPPIDLPEDPPPAETQPAPANDPGVPPAHPLDIPDAD